MEGYLMQRPVVVIVGRKRPHSVMLLIFSLAVGFMFFTGWPRPHSLNSDIKDPLMVWWIIALTLSGAIGILGSYWRGSIHKGLMFERSAMVLGAGAVFGIAWSAFHTGAVSTFAAGFCVVWGIANLARAAQISQDLYSLGRKCDAGRDGQAD